MNGSQTIRNARHFARYSARQHTGRLMRVVLAALCACVLLAALPGFSSGGEGVSAQTSPQNYPGGWKLKLKDAAVVRGEHVLLGEIAEPIGPMDRELWAKIAPAPLWPSPPAGKPMNMTRPKVQQAMAHYARELSGLCIYPASMTLQRGGSVLDSAALQNLVVKTLTPLVRQLEGEASLQDFRLPGSLFLSSDTQTAELEGPFTVQPGRISLKIAVKEMDGSVVRRVTGTVFVDQWVQVPCAAMPLNKDEVLAPERVTFMRKNVAYVKGTVWDGKGGPWRMQRPVAMGQPIMQTDVSVIPTVQKGSTVTMVYQGKNFTVSLPGEALSDGAAGETIAVRNLQSKKQLRATVRDGLTVVVR
ncbi:MAG: hypothetical protein DELT_00974 [Desulfovibrio sp.]